MKQKMLFQRTKSILLILLCLCVNIKAENNIEVRTPARGLSPQHFYELIGKNSNRDIKKGDYIQEDDLK